MSSKIIVRVNRGADTGIQFKNIAPGHEIQHRRRVLSNPANKTSLIRFIVDEWTGLQHREKLMEKILYVTREQTCFKYTREQWEKVP